MARAQERTLVGTRYRVIETLGEGGMAAVERALDTRTGAEVALKRLFPIADAKRRSKLVALFEREFHQLSQMAHPCVVTVYDYGLDGGRPYYTMELLDGGDLRQRAPLDWRSACAVALDVCSALSLVHSRRFVHRDIGPRNIRCTDSGVAKLIDFGATVPMGPNRAIVGTPPMCAPEIVRQQPVDGRTDLYALGATLYAALTGRMAYPARNFGLLEALWQRPLAPPSALVEDVPEALDRLVLDLLQLDMSARPANTAEVIQRLSAIASIEPRVQHEVSQAFLSTPKLVGRDEALTHVRQRLDRLPYGKGAALCATGAAGVGRSRFIDACALEATLAGVTVVRADQADATGEDHEVVRTLASRLVDAAPEAARRAAGDDTLLQRLVRDRLSSQELAAAGDWNQRLRSWVFALCEQHPVLLVVDDVHRVDDASVAWLAALAGQAGDHALFLVASTPSEEPAATVPQQGLAQASEHLELSSLTLQESEALLGSMFGYAPNVRYLTRRLWEVSQGRPRDLMLLAQHLLDTGVVRYDAGAWSLPDQVDTGDLPESIADALKQRVRALGDDARRLARAMSLSDKPRFGFDECLMLSGHDDTARLMLARDELLAAGIVVLVGADHALGPEGWAAALGRECEREDTAPLHLDLARVYETRGDDFRMAQHLFAAGRAQAGLDALLRHASETQQVTDADAREYVKLLKSLPADWVATYDHALELCEPLDRPARDALILRRRAIGAGAYSHDIANIGRFYAPILARLERDAGLDLYAPLDPAAAPGDRIKKALDLAKRRHDSLAERDRIYEPAVAARLLAGVVQTATAVVAETLDMALLDMLPSLAPLAPLSPSIALIESIVKGMRARMAGRTEEARDAYVAVLERVTAPDGAGLTGTYRATAELALQYILCNLEAGMGRDTALHWARAIQDDPLHEANGYQGQALYHLWQGDLKQAARLRARAEQIMIERDSRRAYAATHLLRELPAHALADDMTRVHELTSRVAALAQTHPGWRPVLHYAKGEHARIRGDYHAALEELDASLGLMKPGAHQIWAYAAGAQIHTLCALGRYDEAQARAEAHLADARAAGLGYVTLYIRMPLALARSKRGHIQAAAREADDVIQQFLGMGTTGLNLFLAYEARAMVALGDDPSGFAHYCALAKQQLPEEGSEVLAAKYQRLARMDDSWTLSEGASAADEVSRTLSFLKESSSLDELAARTLSVLLDECGCTQGWLYTVGQEGDLVLVASQADHQLPEVFEARLARHVASEVEKLGATGTTGTWLSVDGASGALDTRLVWVGPAGRRYTPLVLAAASGNDFVVYGVAVALFDSTERVPYPVNTVACLARVGGLAS